MKVTILISVNGYATPDCERDLIHCPTLAYAKREVAATLSEAQRYGAGYDIDGDGGACAWLAYGHVNYIDYPDALLTIGPRGGVRLGHC